jgi:hypothetical protein
MVHCRAAPRIPKPKWHAGHQCSRMPFSAHQLSPLWSTIRIPVIRPIKTLFWLLRARTGMNVQRPGILAVLAHYP